MTLISEGADLITTNGFSDVAVVWMVIAALVPWLSQPLPILRHICALSDFLFEIAEKTHHEYRGNYFETLSRDEIFLRYIKFNRDSYWAFVLMRFEFFDALKLRYLNIYSINLFMTGGLPAAHIVI